ncbi:MAG: response regulator transcription factor [Bacteroidales bacterium]|nr:response regulator transcription factor [Bacteroidales bacterium]MBR4215064.1 response regulator transcription factor [Bacteroidales bacterium]
MNCLVIDDDEAVGVYMRKLIEDTGFLNLLGYYSNPSSAVGYIMSNIDNIDLVFVDVEMPGLTGIDLISSLGTMADKIKFVVISSKDKYAIDALENNVAAYILKPVNPVNFLKAVSKVRNMVENVSQPETTLTFFIRTTDNRYVKINWNDVYWLEVNRNNISINTFDASYEIQSTLKDISTKLPTGLFFKTHRSFIVNISHIDVIEPDFIVMKTSKKDVQIPLSRNYRPEFLANVNVLNRGE